MQIELFLVKWKGITNLSLISLFFLSFVFFFCFLLEESFLRFPFFFFLARSFFGLSSEEDLLSVSVLDSDSESEL